MKKLFLIACVLLFISCGDENCHECSESLRTQTEKTNEINRLKRKNIALQRDIETLQNTTNNLIEMANNSEDAYTKQVLVERTNALVAGTQNTWKELRDNQVRIGELEDEISTISKAEKEKSDTTRNILSVDSVQQEN